MKVKTILLNFCETTSAHGLPHVGSAQNPLLRYFWAVVFLAGSGVFIWQFIILTGNYLQYQVDTQISLSLDDRPFPAVTVCNLNPYKQSMIVGSDIDQLMQEYIRAIGANSNDIDSYASVYGKYGLLDPSLIGNRMKIQSRAEDILLALAAQNSTLVEMATYNQSDLIDGVVFNGVDMGDIDQYMDPIYGACYTFNNITAFNISERAGPIYGMKMTLLVNPRDYLNTTQMAGVRVTIQNQGEPSFPDVLGYNAAPGYTTSFGMTYDGYTQTTRLGPPYSLCTDQSSAQTYYNGIYTTEGCVRSCFQDLIMQKCNCVYARYEYPPTGLDFCQPIIDKTTGKTTNYAFDCVSMTIAGNVSDDSVRNCTDNCFHPCTESTFGVTVSTALWPGGDTPDDCRNTSKWTSQDVCTQWYSDNTAAIEVYFETMEWQSIQEQPAYELVSLVADVSGQMGLWVGFCLVTVAEFFALIVNLIFCRCLAEPKEE